MAVARQDMFNDGTVIMEYYPHKRIILRVAGFKVVVNKPYGTVIYCGGSRTKTLVSPSIQMSTNMTVTLNLSDLNLVMKAINRAIDILNNEKDGLIIDKGFIIGDEIWLENSPEHVLNIQNSKDAKPTELKSIPYKEIASNCVYEDTKGHKWIYLGEGWIYNNGRRDNRCNGPGQPYSKYIYIDFDELSKQEWEHINGTIVCKIANFVIDSYASKKRFVRKVKQLSNIAFNAVVDSNSTIRFIEDKGKSYWK